MQMNNYGLNVSSGQMMCHNINPFQLLCFVYHVQDKMNGWVGRGALLRTELAGIVALVSKDFVVMQLLIHGPTSTEVYVKPLLNSWQEWVVGDYLYLLPPYLCWFCKFMLVKDAPGTPFTNME